MLNGSFDLLGIKLTGEDDGVGSCSLVIGIPLTVGTKAFDDVAAVVVVEETVVVVVGAVVVVVGTGVVVVGAIVVVVGTVVSALITSIIEGFREFNWFLDLDFIRDLNDFRGSLKGLRVGFTTLTRLLVSIKFSLISSVFWLTVTGWMGTLVVVVINDCGVPTAGSDSSWRPTSSLAVSSAIVLKKLLLFRKRFLENKDFLENLFSFLCDSTASSTFSVTVTLGLRRLFLSSGLTGINLGFSTICLGAASGCSTVLLWD